jgi:hypothetical protein
MRLAVSAANNQLISRMVGPSALRATMKFLKPMDGVTH